ncbi:ankyrin-1-like [Aricia agestis]|uniref:ankyrin-1-like n=1 Tax=Aricia agestis TaxID=91739 RepID=UPI001C201D5C|nr:ankyrin-1-like [Aricia agestis]
MDFSSLNPYTSNALNFAARNNDAKDVERLLKKINPNCIDNRGWTCLHEAAANDSYESLLLILKHRGTRPLAETHEGHTALYLACRYKSSLKIIEALLESESDIANYGSTEGLTPLHMVSSQGRLDVMQMLIDYGAMVNVQDFDGDTPLHDTVANSQHEAVNLLLHAGADPEIKNEKGYTPLHLACYNGCLQTIHNLFPYVDNVNQVASNGESPLTLAIQGCNYDIVKYLLDNGADPHVKNIHNETPLKVALNVSHSEIFKLILTITDINKIEPNIVLYACKPHYFKFEILESLLMHNLGPEFFDFYEQFHVTLEKIGEYRPTYLTNAPLNSLLNIGEYIFNQSPDKFIEFFYLFLMRGLSVNAINDCECPPIVYIHYCMHSKLFEQVFSLLIENGCNVDYSSATEKHNREGYMPDAFLASLTSDPTTAPLMMPYSLYCDPEYFLKFACQYGVLVRIPDNAQEQIVSMIGVSPEDVKADTLCNIVLPLQHLCRQKIRSIIRSTTKDWSTQSFFSSLNQLNIPQILKDYIRYANEL